MSLVAERNRSAGAYGQRVDAIELYPIGVRQCGGLSSGVWVHDARRRNVVQAEAMADLVGNHGLLINWGKPVEETRHDIDDAIAALLLRVKQPALHTAVDKGGRRLDVVVRGDFERRMHSDVHRQEPTPEGEGDSNQLRNHEPHPTQAVK